MTKEEAINILIREAEVDTNKISDGNHTFEEVYAHRIMLFITTCRLYNHWRSHDSGINYAWRSLCHSDGSHLPGWFIMGLFKEPGKQITYHIPEKYWDDSAFAVTLDLAPDWDGHSPEDALNRLKELL